MEEVRFWCDKCDGCLVDKNDPETGLFFVQAGCDIKDGSWRTVEWAVCACCLALGITAVD